MIRSIIPRDERDDFGNTIVVAAIAPSETPHPSFEHDAEHPTHRHWSRFCAWRRSKCDVRDLCRLDQKLEEIDQATHQIVGEVAELADVLQEHGALVFSDPRVREKLLGEMGDVFFSAAWALDAWGHNRLSGCNDAGVSLVSLVRLHTPDHECEIRHLLDLIERAPEEYERLVGEGAYPQKLTREHLAMVGFNSVVSCALSASVFAGLTADAYKKIRWQRRPQERRLQGEQIMLCLGYCERILHLLGYEVEDALKAVIEKIDTRYPTGVATPPGGFRTGKGA